MSGIHVPQIGAGTGFQHDRPRAGRVIEVPGEFQAGHAAPGD
jgi:hypothetical protein